MLTKTPDCNKSALPIYSMSVNVSLAFTTPLKIKVKTFDNHKYSLMFKLGVKGLPEIIKLAIDLKKSEKDELESHSLGEY